MTGALAVMAAVLGLAAVTLLLVAAVGVLSDVAKWCVARRLGVEAGPLPWLHRLRRRRFGRP